MSRKTRRRRYSIVDIRRMRAAVDTLCPVQEGKATAVEQRVQTYILAGVTPAELESEVQVYRDEVQRIIALKDGILTET